MRVCKKVKKVSHTPLPSVYRVPELIPVLDRQPAVLSARPAVTLATLKRAATNFAA